MSNFAAHLTSASLLTLTLIGLCVSLHYEALNLLARSMQGGFRSHRVSLLVTMFGLLLVHSVQIWIFGIGYWVAEEWLSVGQVIDTTVGIEGGFSSGWFDYVYYSAAVYTTVGFGDLVPTAGLRVLTSGEALTGFSLITWSASFTFIQMSRLWLPPRDAEQDDEKKDD